MNGIALANVLKMSKIMSPVMRLKTFLAISLSVSVLGVVHALAADVDVSKIPPPSTKTGLTYEKDVRPIFEKSCFKCHGPDVEKPKGKLRLDTLAAAMKGGENGPNIIAGNSAKSQLVHAIAGVGEEDSEMPPKKNKSKIPPLTAEQIGVIRAWIDQGAK